MKKIEVVRTDGVFEVLILQHKGKSEFSFVNLTKGLYALVFSARNKKL